MNWTFCILCTAREIFSKTYKPWRSEEYYGTHPAAHGRALGLISTTLFLDGKTTGRALYRGLESLGSTKRDVFITFVSLYALKYRRCIEG